MSDFSTVIQSLALCIQTRTPVLLEGPVGDAKTSIVEALGHKFCTDQYTSIVALHDPPEYGGAQVPQDAIRNPEGQIVRPAVVEQVPLAWVHRLAKTKRPLLFLDEFTNGVPATRAATMRGVLEGYWGDAQIPNLAVVVAQNPAHIAESGYELSAALSNRFCHLPWDMPVEYWMAAYAAGFPVPHAPVLPEDWEQHRPWARTMISSFAKHIPTSVKAMPTAASERSKPFPSFRSWTRVETLLAACRACKFGIGKTENGVELMKVDDVTMLLVSGCVGTGAAIEFFTHASSLDLPDPEELLARPKSLQMPPRSDQKFAVLNSVVNAVVGRLTPQRWYAAWDVMGEAARQNYADVAAACVKTLVSVQPKEAIDPPKAIDHFTPLLKAAGIFRY